MIESGSGPEPTSGVVSDSFPEPVPVAQEDPFDRTPEEMWGPDGEAWQSHLRTRRDFLRE